MPSQGLFILLTASVGEKMVFISYNVLLTRKYCDHSNESLVIGN